MRDGCFSIPDKSPINRYADIRLYTVDNPSSFFQESLVSRVAQILIIDILYASYALKHYNKSIKKLEESATALVRFLHNKTG